MAKKINHRGHGGHRELLFSLCPLCPLWFSKTHFQKIIKSLLDNVEESKHDLKFESRDYTGLEQIIPINRKNHLVEICVKQRFGMDGG